MSGIAGIVALDGAPLSPEWVARMTTALAHRGPDGATTWTAPGVALGHLQMHTTVESLDERQPLSSEDGGVTLVFDGRLDNWVELRQDLLAQGARLRDRSDAELVLRAYQTWGRDCLARLDGDFACAIRDEARRVLFCARDRLGHRPFVYHHGRERFAFASEPAALLTLPWLPRTLDLSWLADYLELDWRSREATPWVGVRRLPPAHWMEVGAHGCVLRQYWQPDLHAPISYTSDEAFVDHYRAVLIDSVRRTSRSHLPVACEVSGGLDSSAVFAVAARLQHDGALPAPGLRGFTLRFDGPSDADELAYARAVAAHVQVPVAEVAPTLPPLAWYADVARESGECPGYPNGVMGLGIRQAARADGARVLLTGAGGDEWLEGSAEAMVETISAREWRELLRLWRQDVRDRGPGAATRWLARSTAVAVLPPPLVARLRTIRRRHAAPADLESWLHPMIASSRRPASAEASHALTPGRAGHAALLASLFAPYDLLAHEAEERLAARAGIDLRLPLATTAMVQFAFSTPDRLRARGALTKVLHRRALAGWLPPSVLTRTTKADFMVTFRHYADELRAALAPGRRADLEAWVRTDALDHFRARFGDASSDGEAEWRLWGLLAWRSLLDGSTTHGHTAT